MKVDRLVLLSLPYGVFISAIGVAVVFFTLMIVALVSEVLKRLFRLQESDKEGGKLMKVAALAAAQYFMGQDFRPSSRRVSWEGRSNWAAAARIEALERGVDRDR